MCTVSVLTHRMNTAVCFSNGVQFRTAQTTSVGCGCHFCQIRFTCGMWIVYVNNKSAFENWSLVFGFWYEVWSVASIYCVILMLFDHVYVDSSIQTCNFLTKKLFLSIDLFVYISQALTETIMCIIISIIDDWWKWFGEPTTLIIYLMLSH